MELKYKEMENHLNTNKIPTAEEFYKQTTGCVMNHKDIKIAMIEFTKLHVEAQKEAIKLNIKDFLETNGLYLSDDWELETTGNSVIDQAYSLENIK